MKYAYWLANIQKLSAAKKKFMLEQGISAEELYYMSSEKIKRLEGLSKDEIKRIQDSKKTWNLEKEWFHLMSKGIGFVSLEQENFPERLRHIPSAPYALYYIGKIPDENRKSVSIVGARGCSAYGSEVARLLAKALANHGIQVVSGLARGIDGEAHKGTLDADGDTYGVLGSGIDICYPHEHRYLYDKIIQKGGVISEYPPGVQPVAHQFPARNRIISGLSDCVVIIEAREKSGSLITADCAMEQGRDVYALPGRITDSLSQGCNQLIKQGAGIVKSVEDFLLDLDILTENAYMQLDFRTNILEKDERLVYSLTDFRPVGLSEIIEKTDFPITKILEIIERLKSMGLIKETFANYYVRVINK